MENTHLTMIFNMMMLQVDTSSAIESQKIKRRENTKIFMCNCQAMISVSTKDDTEEATVTLHLTHTGHEPGSPYDAPKLSLRHEVKAELLKMSKLLRDRWILDAHMTDWVRAYE